MINFCPGSRRILAALALNIPTLAFWQNIFKHFIDSAVTSKSEMAGEGVFYLNPQSIEKTVNETWDSVEF